MACGGINYRHPAEIGRNPVSKHPLVENEQTGAVLREQGCGFVRCLKPTQRHIYIDLGSDTFDTVGYFEYRIAAPVDDCRWMSAGGGALRDGTAESVSPHQILRHERGQGSICFPCSANHKRDWQPNPAGPYSSIYDGHTLFRMSWREGDFCLQ